MSKLTMPQGRKEWAKTILVALLLSVVVSVFVGAPYAGWWPAYGRSAWPTMKWWVVPPYLSGYYHVDYNDKDPESGDIVWFWVPGHWPQTEVKRVDKVEIQGGESCMWLTADNSGMTGEGSDFSDRYHWVPTRLVIGTIDNIWTPTRWSRSHTPPGRYWNETSFRFPPTSYEVSGDVMVLKTSPLTVVSADGIFFGGEKLLGWEDGIPVVALDPDGERVAMVVRGRAVDAPPDVASEYFEAHYDKASETYNVEAVVVREGPENVYLRFCGLASKLPDGSERSVAIEIGDEVFGGSNKISVVTEGGVVSVVYFSDPEKAPLPGKYNAVLRGARG